MKKLEYNPLSGEFEMSSSPMVMVSYHELKALRDSGVLEPGCQYRITDYNLVIDDAPSENPARSANHVFDIVVTALSEKDLSEDAKAVRNERDTYFANSNLDAWQIKYCLDNDNSRFAWAYPDKVLGFTANRVFYENIPASDVIYEGEKYLAFVNGEDYLYLWVNDLGDPDATLYVYVDDYFSGKIMEPTAITGIAYQKASNPGRGVIYYMKDEFGNEAPYDFKNVMFYISSDEAGVAGLRIGYHYTFTEKLKGSDKADYSLKSNCSNNVIKEYIIDGKLHLNRNIILSSDAYPECHGNFFDRDCRNIVIGCGSENKFGLGCYDINLLGSNRRNVFGSGCKKCLLDLGCENNTIGDECQISMAMNVENITVGNGIITPGFIDAKPYTCYFMNSYGEVKITDKILIEKNHIVHEEVTEDNPVFTLRPSTCCFIKKPVNKLYIELAAENLKDNYTREYELIFNTGASSDGLPNIRIPSLIKFNKTIEFACDRTYVLRITRHCYGGGDMTIGTIDEYNFKS